MDKKKTPSKIIRAKIAKATRAPPAARAMPTIEDDERHRDLVDDFIARNRDALNDSIRRSRRELARGERSTKTIDDIVAEGRKRHTKRL